MSRDRTFKPVRWKELEVFSQSGRLFVAGYSVAAKDGTQGPWHDLPNKFQSFAPENPVPTNSLRLDEREPAQAGLGFCLAARSCQRGNLHPLVVEIWRSCHSALRREINGGSVASERAIVHEVH
jgi:hypothetical protein